MGTPLGDFIRANRNAADPTLFGGHRDSRRRTSGLRRSEVAAQAGVSVEYLTRIEQGRDRRPSTPVLNAIAEALRLTAASRRHMLYLAKITAGACTYPRTPMPPPREVRSTVLETLSALDPRPAMVGNHLGDVLAHTEGFTRLMDHTGLFDDPEPNLTRYVFTDPRATRTFPEWDQIADEQAYHLWLGPSVAAVDWFVGSFVNAGGDELKARLRGHRVPEHRPLVIRGPDGRPNRWQRETLAVNDDAMQGLTVYFPAEPQSPSPAV